MDNKKTPGFLERLIGTPFASSLVILLIGIAVQPWTFFTANVDEGFTYWLMNRSVIIFGVGVVAVAMMFTHSQSLRGIRDWRPVIAHMALVVSVVIGAALALQTSTVQQQLIGIADYGWGLYAVFGMLCVTIVVFMTGSTSSRAALLTIRVLTIAAVSQAVLAVAQFVLGFDPIEPLTLRTTSSIVHGVSGRDDALALLLAPFVLLVMHDLRTKLTIRAAWVPWVVLLVLVLAINATDNRAAFIAVAAAGLTLLIASRSVRALAPYVASVVLMIVPLPVFNPEGAAANSAGLMLSSNTRTLETRLGAWRAGLQELDSLPLNGFFGLGPVGFSLAQRDYMDFDAILPVYILEYDIPYEDPRTIEIIPNPEPLRSWARIEDQATGRTRTIAQGFAIAHNAIIDYLYQGGWIAAFSWIFLVAGGIIVAFRRGEWGLSSAVLAGAIAYQALYPIQHVDPTFHALVALAWASPQRGNRDDHLKAGTTMNDQGT